MGLGSLAERNFELESSDGSTVAFRHQSSGVVVRKVYSFEPDGYAFTLRLKVENGSKAVVPPRFGVDWPVHTMQGPDYRDQALAARTREACVASC